MKIYILIALFCASVFVIGVFKIVSIYKDVYPYKKEYQIYYVYEIVGNDTIAKDTIRYTLD